jgi:cell division septation protein DedD
MPASTAPAAPDVTSIDHSEESATATLYRAATGPVNADYYLPIFTRFEAAGRVSPSWNWAASLYTLNWLLFRKLWLAAGVYGAAVLGTVLVLFQFPDALEPSLLLVLAALSVVVPGFYGNALLHQSYRQKMAQALSSSPSLVQACAMLNCQVSSRQGFIWLALINGALLCVAVGAYWLWPAADKAPPASASAGEVRHLAAGRVTDLTSAPVPVVSAASASLAPVVEATQPASAPSAVAPLALAASAPLPVLAPASAAVPVPVSPASVAVPALAREAVKEPVKESVKVASVPAVLAAPKAAPHFAINVGLFAKDANAQKVHAQLKAAKLPVYTQALHTSKGQLTRVRVGPFKSQKAAQAAAKKIHALKLDAVVFEP